MGYLEDKDGNPPSYKTAKAIYKVIHGGWVEHTNQELAPPSWGRLSASAQQLIHGLMENAYPDFKFANNGWKLNFLEGSAGSNGPWPEEELDASVCLVTCVAIWAWIQLRELFDADDPTLSESCCSSMAPALASYPILLLKRDLFEVLQS
ncbi:hypothetical protein EV401DRAFT_1894452 [Pisolithus croceorrhizus]|nr:hypothetical protein EV401DRAFT_1894452 [Pisolithus croceorrhizus]